MNFHNASEKTVLVTIAMVGATAILPFCLMRLWQGDWLTGSLDGLLVLGLFGFGMLARLTGQLHWARNGLTALALSGLVTLVYIKGEEVCFWAYPLLMASYFVFPGRQAVTISAIAIPAIALALTPHLGALELTAVVITLITSCGFSYVFTEQVRFHRAELEHLAQTDSLTRLENRSAMNIRLSEIIALNHRNPQTVSLIVFDVDHFKQVNDRHGHTTGDRVLIRLAQTIKSRIRATDYLYRFGGEEFALLASAADAATAEALAEDIRNLVQNSDILEGHPITISLGVAELRADDSMNSWLNRADKAMYAAKSAGRNTTRVAP